MARPPSLPSSRPIASKLPVRTESPKEIPVGLQKTDKWKAASHLQKAIRHGRPDDAVQAVDWLMQIEPSYLRYRMAVIAVEDVAGGSPALVARAMEGGWNKASIEAKGGVDFLKDQARLWAQSTKDRTACTWMGCTRWLSEFEALHGPWEGVDMAQALALAFDVNQSWWVRGLAAWRCAGTKKFPSGVLPVLEGDWEKYLHRAGDVVDNPDMIEVAAAGGRHQNEAHPVFLPLVAQSQACELCVEQDRSIPQLGYVGPWLSAALDKHTAEGKRALRNLLWANAPGRAWLRQQGCDDEVSLEAVGRLWFWMEGGLVDKARTYPTAELIDQDVKRRSLEDMGISGRGLFEFFGRNGAAWQQARLKALGVAASAARPVP